MLFGAKRIPEIMGGIGKGIKTFKSSMETEDPPAPQAATPQPHETKDEAKPVKPA
jgi:sec-independent protein translocase protein TatA